MAILGRPKKYTNQSKDAKQKRSNKAFRKWIINHKEQHAKMTKEWRLKNKKLNNKLIHNWHMKHLKKWKAQYTTYNLFKQTNQIKENCAICNTTKNIELHHPNYNIWYHIYFLCKVCHRKIHAKYKGE